LKKDVRFLIVSLWHSIKCTAYVTLKLGVIWDDKCGYKNSGAVTIYYNLYTTFYWGELQNVTETQSMWAYLNFKPRDKYSFSWLQSSVMYCVVIFSEIMGL
jgi:hypothetical protein